MTKTRNVRRLNTGRTNRVFAGLGGTMIVSDAERADDLRAASAELKQASLTRPQSAMIRGEDKNIKLLQQIKSRPGTVNPTSKTTRLRRIQRKNFELEQAQGKGTQSGTEVAVEALVKSIAGNLQQRYNGKKSLRKVFLAWDENHDGVVDPYELRLIFNKVGCCISKKQALEICRIFGDESRGVIPYDGFLDLIFKDVEVQPSKQADPVQSLRERLRQLGLNEEEIDKAAASPKHHLPMGEIIKRLKTKFQAKRSLNQEFRLIDDDKNGQISVDELHNFLLRNNLETSPEEIAQLFSKFDRSNDGMVDYSEFIKLVFPPKDIGAFKRLTPRSDDSSDDEEYDRRVERDTGKKVVIRKPSRDVGKHLRVDTHDMNAEVKSQIRGAVVGARIRQNILKQLRSNYNTVRGAFDALDANKDGLISYPEFRTAIMNIEKDLKPRDIEMFLRYVDRDGSGYVEYSEFKALLDAGEPAKNDHGRTSFRVASQNSKKALTPIEKSKNQQEESDDHHVGNLRTATTANIGLALSNRIPNKLQTSRVALKRKLFPEAQNAYSTQETRPSTAKPSSSRAFMNRCKSDGALLNMQQVNRSRFNLEDFKIEKNKAIPKPCNFKPTHRTKDMFVHDGESVGSQRSHYKSSFALDPAAAYHMQPEQTRRRQLTANRLDRKRAAEARYNDVHRTPAFIEDPDRHLKTILKHRLNYYTRIDAALKREERKKSEW